MPIAAGKKRVMVTLAAEVLTQFDALCRERGQYRGPAIEAMMRRSLARRGVTPAKPADPRQVDLEEAIEDAAVPDLGEADLRAGAEAAAKLGVQIDVEAAYADWRRFVAGMDEEVYSPVGHWIAFCRKRAREAG